VTHKLSVTVPVDLDGRTIRVLATGCLTVASQRALHPLIRRARTLTPGIHVTVDCTGVHHVEPTGVELLRAAVDHDEGSDGLRPVEFLFSDPLRGPAGTQGHGHRTTSARALQHPQVSEIRGGVSSAEDNPKVVPARAAS
jgi:hypothetical protein